MRSAQGDVQTSTVARGERDLVGCRRDGADLEATPPTATVDLVPAFPAPIDAVRRHESGRVALWEQRDGTAHVVPGRSRVVRDGQMREIECTPPDRQVCFGFIGSLVQGTVGQHRPTSPHHCHREEDGDDDRETLTSRAPLGRTDLGCRTPTHSRSIPRPATARPAISSEAKPPGRRPL